MKIIILTMFLTLTAIVCCWKYGLIKTTHYNGAISDHFDGRKFFNTDYEYSKITTWNVFKWWLSRDRSKWPEHFSSLITHIPLGVNKPNLIRVTFVNHATILIQTQQLTILTDPIWSQRASPFTWIGPKRVRNPGIRFSDLPLIDVVLISHNHYDHLDIKTLIALDKKFHPLFLVPLGNKALLNKYSIDNVIEMDWWQQHTIKNSIVTLLPSKHWSARGINDKFNTLWGSYGIEVEGKKVYFAGDTGYGKHFIDIKNKWGKPTVAFLPIGAYLPEFIMRSNHLNPNQAVQAHLDLEAVHSIAIHFNTFQLSDELIDQPTTDLKTALKKYHISNKQFIVLKEGECKDF